MTCTLISSEFYGLSGPYEGPDRIGRIVPSFHRLVKCGCEEGTWLFIEISKLRFIFIKGLWYMNYFIYPSCKLMRAGQGSTVLFFFFLTIFQSSHAACGILVPRPEIKPARPAVGSRSLNHWTTREVQGQSCFRL